MLKNNRGMTLIEIMIVLAIIGGLIAILAPRFTGQLSKSRVKETQIEMNQIMTQLNMYNSDCGRYPESLNNLVENSGDECPNWGPEPYLKKAPKDAWQNDFVYELNGNQFTLRSLGADRREGGDGYDKDLSSEDL